MKLTRLTPVFAAVVALSGSAAFANCGACGTIMTQPAVIAQPAVVQPMVIENASCGTCGIMTRPAVVNTGCGVAQPVVNACPAPVCVGPATPSVITRPMFIQGTNPVDIRLFGQ
jgi:hypothetical protein